MSDSPVIHAEQAPFRALPSNVTFRNLIQTNKRRSMLLMIGMSLLLVALGAVFGGLLGAMGSGEQIEVLAPSIILGAVVAIVIAVGACSWSYYQGANAILRMASAVELERHQDPQLFNVVEELSIAAGIPMPKVYIINDTAMNAFATGRDPEHGVVAITHGLREKLNRDELAGVIAHELSHVRHYDIRLMMLMATMVGLIVLASDGFKRVLWHGQRFSGGAVGRRASHGGKGGAGLIIVIFMILALLLSILAPILALVIRFAVSRQREYLADAGAVELTRYPQGLIGALEKLGACREPLEIANRATAHLYIVNPLRSAMRGEGHNLNSMFQTHPPLQSRIDRLRALLR